MVSNTWNEEKIDLLKCSNEESHRLTVESIEEAFIQLLEKESFENITVSGIAKRAGVSRTAFYKNFKTKEELLKNYTEVIMDKMMRGVDEFDDDKGALEQYDKLEFWEIFLDRLARKKDLFMLLIRENGSRNSNLFDDNMVKKYFQYIYNIDNEYLPIYYSGAISNVLAHWIEKGMVESVEEMARFLNEPTPLMLYDLSIYS
ncbi:MAG: TetR/AcrR family transcriptional regulator [Lachnospiraceae bacterium]|nr:TetR/AcrR family transcriptional regulator [Lachnospiraceae bacterium]